MPAGPVSQQVPIPSPLVEDTSAPALAFDEVYQRWFHEVCRWARALGAPPSDLEDVAQNTFLVVRRRLGDFSGGNLAGWLFLITRSVVRDHRRLTWFRHVLLGRTSGAPEPAAEEREPLERLEREQARRVLWRLLDRLPEKKRTVLVLHEIEGCSGAEIAELLGVPVDTVWTRLHHARRALEQEVRRYRAAEER